jgi:hypothetical protein
MPSSIEALERGRGGETYCHNEMLVSKVLLYYLGSFESNYIMSRNVEIWELLLEMSKFGILFYFYFFWQRTKICEGK